MIRRGTANFAITGTDWQQKIKRDRLCNYRHEGARERMKARSVGAMLYMYEENARDITESTAGFTLGLHDRQAMEIEKAPPEP